MSYKLATIDEIKLIRTIMAELTRQAELDITVFGYDRRKYTHSDFLNASEYDGEPNALAWKARATWIDITFMPELNKNHSLREVEKVEICWCSQMNRITVELVYSSMVSVASGSIPFRRKEDSYTATYQFGANSELSSELYKDYLKFRLEIVRLYKKIKTYQEDYLPRKKKQDFEAAVYGTFPALLDNILMENDDGQKES